MTTRQTACTLGALLLLIPTTTFARTNILTAGLSTSYDYDQRQDETLTVDSQAVTGVATANSRDDDYSRLVVRPLLRFNSNSPDDQFELRAAPAIRYDLIDAESDWDADLSLSYARSITREWRLRAGNAFIRSDSYDPQAQNTVDSGNPERQNTLPELATNRGRIQYWRNTSNVTSEYLYRQDSLVSLGLDYTVLRNDESEVGTSEDYDRTALNVTHNHRFEPFWTSGVNMSFVRGDYDNTIDTTTATQAETGLTEDVRSSDLWEYHLLASLANTSFQRHNLSLNYTYSGTKYDDELQNDGDIHQLQLTWRHEYSQQITTTLGAGPSYAKSEGQDATWGGNGIAAIDYRLEHSAFALAVEKGYEVDNFSGTDQRGNVDFWNIRFNVSYQLLDSVSLTGLMEYRHENREDPAGTPAATILSEYTNEQFTAGGGLTYSFMRYYSAALNYTFNRYDSERIGEDYDEHRLLLTLSWEQEWLRW